MNALKEILARADRFLDDCHYRTIWIILAIATVAWIANLHRWSQYSAVIELAFTVDWILAGMGLGVLAHLLTSHAHNEARR